jgi:hypothetical protein
MHTVLIFFFLLLAGAAQAQDYENAQAVIEYDKGNSFFFITDDVFTINNRFFQSTPQQFRIRFTRDKQVTIKQSAAISRYREWSREFYRDGQGNAEVVLDFKVEVSGPDGTTTYTLKDLTETQTSDRLVTKRLIIPNLAAGSTITYHYVLETPFIYRLPDWKFQGLDPARYSEYELRLPPFYEYTFQLQGVNTRSLDVKEAKVDDKKRKFGNAGEYFGKTVGGIEFQDVIQTFGLKDVPAFTDTAYIASVDNHLMGIDFQLNVINQSNGSSKRVFATWNEVIDRLDSDSDFGKYQKKAGRKSRSVVRSLNLPSDKTKAAKQVIDYIKNRFRWNGYYSLYASGKAKDVLNSKRGNSADINLLLTAMLQEAGIKAFPVVISTRGHGAVTKGYASEETFNHVIVQVYTDSEQYFLTDATAKDVYYNYLLPQSINGEGLQANGVAPVWVPVAASTGATEKVELTHETENNQLTTRLTLQADGYAAWELCNQLENKTVESYLSRQGLGKTTVHEIDSAETMRVNIESVHTLKAGASANELSIRPFAGLPLQQNLLQQDNREIPVDFIYSRRKEFKATIQIPAGLSVQALPEAVDIDNELAQLKLQHEVTNEEVLVQAVYHFKKGVYTSSEYARVKYYLGIIADRFNQPVKLSTSTEIEE